MAPHERELFDSHDYIHQLVEEILRIHAARQGLGEPRAGGTLPALPGPGNTARRRHSEASGEQTILLDHLAATVVETIQANLSTVLAATQFVRDALRDVDGDHDILIRKLSSVQQTTGDAMQALRQLQTYADTAFEWGQIHHGHRPVQLNALIKELTVVEQLSRDAVRALCRL